MDAERVDVGDAHLIGLEAGAWEAQMTAFGSRDGAPFVLTVAEDGNLIPFDLPGNGHVTSVAGWESTLVATQDGPRARLFGITNPSVHGSRDVHPEDDEYTRSAARLWVACGSEDPGYVIADDHGRLTGVDEGGDGKIPPAGRLKLKTPGAPLLVSQGEGTLYLAGSISDGDSDPRESLWMIDTYGTREVTTEAGFTAVTDISNVRLEPFIAGHHEGRAVVIDDRGRELPTPPAQLDADRPTVLLAQTRVLVIQAREGIQAWTYSSGEWEMRTLPGGTLQAARVGYPPILWYIADSALWRLPF